MTWGLLAEEVDPDTREPFLGNIPQAFSHKGDLLTSLERSMLSPLLSGDAGKRTLISLDCVTEQANILKAQG